MSIQKVLICGLGAVGITVASQIQNISDIDLRILANDERYEKYKKTPQVFNGKKLFFNYIKPYEKFFPDLIIVSTKSYGLDSVLDEIFEFVSENTIIISLINGISSEEIITKRFPKAKVLKSFFIGHSAVRLDENVYQDGVWEIVCEQNETLSEFFRRVDIKYSNPDDIDYSMWLKFALNVVSNQISGILDLTFGELKKNIEIKNITSKIVNEVKEIAKCRGIKNLENLEADTFKYIDRMCEDGKTSMLQDILAKRKTEVDIFAGEIIKLGKLYGVDTPYNSVLYDLIKIKEEANEHSIHTC